MLQNESLDKFSEEKILNFEDFSRQKFASKTYARHCLLIS